MQEVNRNLQNKTKISVFYCCALCKVNCVTVDDDDDADTPLEAMTFDIREQNKNFNSVLIRLN